MTTPDPDLPPRPAPPEPGECCGGGCARCVLDVYAEELERWERRVAELTERAEPSGPPQPPPRTA
jgi:hypothetical protein